MELGENSKKMRSAYEVSLERFPVNNNYSDTSPPEPSPLEDDFFVKEDHVSIHDKSLKRTHSPSSVKKTYTRKSVHDQKDEESSKSRSEELENLTDFPNMPQPQPENYEVACQWMGPMLDYGGYARMNRTYVFGLKQRGALVKTRVVPSIENVNQKTQNYLQSLSSVSVPSNYPKIYGMTIPDVVTGGKKILYTMMETSLKVHPEYVDRLNLADEIWVPCTWNQQVFKDSGVLPPIKVMPLGVDTNLFKPSDDPMKFNAGSFRFLSVFGWSFRKGFDVLIQAFLEEFSKDEDVSLILSTRFAGRVDSSAHRRILEDFNYVKSLVSRDPSDMPHIALHSDYTKDIDMPRIYAAANCFVLISRGEGMGLPYLEAASCGLPVIASDHGGQKDFLNEDNSYLVEPDDYFQSKVSDPPFRNLAWISHFYENQHFPHYGTPAINKVRGHLRNVYENYSEAQEKAKKLRAKVMAEFDWNCCIDKVYNRLSDICKETRGL